MVDNMSTHKNKINKKKINNKKRSKSKWLNVDYMQTYTQREKE